MKRWHFVYAPCAGAKWIRGAEPRGRCVVPYVTYGNKSAHVHGYDVSIFAAKPRHHWRAEAGRMTASLARRMRGVAWDDCGEIHIVVDNPDQARKALRLLFHAAAAFGATRVSEDAAAALRWDEDLVRILRAGFDLHRDVPWFTGELENDFPDLPGRPDDWAIVDSNHPDENGSRKPALLSYHFPDIGPDEIPGALLHQLDSSWAVGLSVLVECGPLPGPMWSRWFCSAREVGVDGTWEYTWRQDSWGATRESVLP